MAKALNLQQVMQPVELGVSAKILEHAHGKTARLIFDYLLAQAGMRYGLDEEGFAVVSQARLESLGVNSCARRRGLQALEELGLVELRQEGHGAYRARLLYRAPTTTRTPRSAKQRTRRPDPPIDHAAYDTLRAAVETE